MLERFTIDTGLDSGAHGFDLLDHPGHVVELSIIDSGGLPSPNIAVLLQLYGDDVRVRHGMACDVEGLLEREFFDGNAQRQRPCTAVLQRNAPSKQTSTNRSNSAPARSGSATGQPNSR